MTTKVVARNSESALRGGTVVLQIGYGAQFAAEVLVTSLDLRP
jgi:hypothetical protein